MENSNSNQNSSEEEDQKYTKNVHTTSQKHKTKKKSYKIDPSQIPRPNSFNELYQNEGKKPIFSTCLDLLPPFASTFYKVNEIENSNCRFIRSSMIRIPKTQKILSDTHLIFGIYLNPFAELNEDEYNQINKVDVDSYDQSTKIFRCSFCGAYLNKKFEITYNFKREKVIKCNICEGLNQAKNNDNFYFLTNLSSGTLEYNINNYSNVGGNKEEKKEFHPHYAFFIDISFSNYSCGFSNYIINSIKSSIDNFHNKEGSYISISAFNEKGIYFFYVENNDVKCTVVTDIKESFCPVDEEKRFILLRDNNEIIEIMFEKLCTLLEKIYTNTKTKTNSKVSCIFPAINAGIQSLINTGGRVVLFTSSTCSDYNKAKIDNLVNICNSNIIVIDQFILVQNSNSNQNIQQVLQFIRDFSHFSNETGGRFNLYTIDQTSTDSIINSTYEKIYYDYINIISNNNYYNVRFMIRYSKGIDCYEILGVFGKKLGEAFQISGCDTNFSFCYLFRIDEDAKLYSNQDIDFQIACLSIDNYSKEKLRLFNYSIKVTKDVNKIYTNCDVDVISKLTLMREIMLNFYNSSGTENINTNIVEINNKMIKNIYSRILVSFKFYRKNGASDKDPSQLVLPATLKYFPLFLFSFIQKKIFYDLYDAVSTEKLFFKIQRDSVDSLIKFLYPRFYRVDDIEYGQRYNALYVNDKSLIIKDIGLINEFNIIQKPYMLRLSLDNIDFDSAFLINDGEYINFYVFESLNTDFYSQLFNKENWNYCFDDSNNIGDIVCDDNNKFNVKIRNIIKQCRDENNLIFLPLRIFFLNQRYLKNKFYKFLTQYLIEDQIILDKNYNIGNYIDFLCKLHNDIQKE